MLNSRFLRSSYSHILWTRLDYVKTFCIWVADMNSYNIIKFNLNRELESFTSARCTWNATNSKWTCHQNPIDGWYYQFLSYWWLWGYGEYCCFCKSGQVTSEDLPVFYFRNNSFHCCISLISIIRITGVHCCNTE